MPNQKGTTPLAGRRPDITMRLRPNTNLPRGRKEPPVGGFLDWRSARARGFLPACPTLPRFQRNGLEQTITIKQAPSTLPDNFVNANAV
jgi:hypothetical protein